MLNLTESAITALAGITAQSGLPSSGGVRITLTDSGEQVELALAPEPEAGDHVIDESGVRVFVDEQASPKLSEHVLDAQEVPDGVGFALRKAS